MTGWQRFNSQFRETEWERNKRLRESYRRRLARETPTSADAGASPSPRQVEGDKSRDEQ